MSSFKRSLSCSSMREAGGVPAGASLIPVFVNNASGSRRESKLPIRQSRISEAQARISQQKRRSKSLDKFCGKNSLLTPLTSRNFNKGSCSGSKRKTRLIASRSPISSAITVKKVDKRPINDKEWQKEQLVKVQNFFEKSLVSLKVKAGLSIEMFVSAVNYLFKRLDDRIEITRENYIEEVPARLKIFRYPAAVKPSLMKTVNVPRTSWPHVLAILSWLVELIEKLDQLKNESLLPLGVSEHDADVFMAKTNVVLGVMKKKLKGEVDFKECFEEYELRLREISNIDTEKIETYKNETESLRKQLIKLTEEEQEISKKNQEYESKITNTKNHIENLKSTENEKEVELKKLKENLEERRTLVEKKREELLLSIKELQEIISNQKYDAKERDKYLQNVPNLVLVKKLKEERLAELKEINSTNDLKWTESRRNVQMIVNKINNTLKDAKRIKPEFAIKTLRENKFVTEPGFLDEIEEFKNQYELEKSESVKELEVLEENYLKLIESRKEVDKTHDQLLIKFRELENKCELVEKEVLEQKLLQESELGKLQKQIAIAEREYAVIEQNYQVDYKTSLDLKDKLEKIKNKNEAERKRLVEKGKAIIDLFGKACLSVSENRKRERKLLMDIRNEMITEHETSIAELNEFVSKLENMNEELEKKYKKLNDLLKSN